MLFRSAVQEAIPLTVVLLDNHGFRCIGNLATSCGGERTFQDFRMRDAATGSLTGGVLPLDLAANAASLGAVVHRAGSPDELAAALAATKDEARPVVIVTEIDTTHEVPGYDSWWDVPVAEVSERAEVRAKHAAYVDAVARIRQAH